MITAKAIAPIMGYKQEFKNTYLWGSYSPIDGDAFVYETESVNTQIFQTYLNDFSKHKPNEYKIMVIDNASFHPTKDIVIPDTIFLLRIPSYTPGLNPCEHV